MKPLALMRWLVRLTCPAGGLVLDPFGGSGTTGEACVIEGMRAVLIEREPAYWSLIEQRLTKPIELDLFSSVPAPTGRTGEPSADRRYGDSGATPFTMTPGPRYDRPARTPEPTTALFD